MNRADLGAMRGRGCWRGRLAHVIGTMLLVVTSLIAQGAIAQAVPSDTVGAWATSGMIRYDVLRGDGGLKLGEAEHRWQQSGGRYEMQTTLETTGLAAVLYDFSYVQHSEGRIVEGRLRPELFRVVQRGRDPETARIDWDASKVVIERKGRVKEESVSEGDQDVLSVWHVLATSAGRALPASLSLVSNRRVSGASLSVIGQEMITLPAGTMEAQRVKLQARSGRLTIELWLAERHRLAPVRILMTDDKGEVLDMRAVDIAVGAG